MLTRNAINLLPSHCHLSASAQALPGCRYMADGLSCSQHGPAAAGQIPPAPTSHGAGAAPAPPGSPRVPCSALLCQLWSSWRGAWRPAQPRACRAAKISCASRASARNPPEQVPPRSGLPIQTLLLGYRPARPCLPRPLCPGSHAGRSRALGPIRDALCTTGLSEPRSCRTTGTSRGQRPTVHSPSKALLTQQLHTSAPAQQRPGVQWALPYALHCTGRQGGACAQDAASEASTPPAVPPCCCYPRPQNQGATGKGLQPPRAIRAHGPAGPTLTLMQSTPSSGSPGQPAACLGSLGQSCGPGLGTVAWGGPPGHGFACTEHTGIALTPGTGQCPRAAGSCWPQVPVPVPRPCPSWTGSLLLPPPASTHSGTAQECRR